MRRPSLLSVYLFIVAATAVPLLGWVTLQAFYASYSIPWVMVIMLTTGALVGESMPIDLARGRRASTVTFSGGFSFALVLICPLIIPLLVQTIAVLFQHVKDRRPWVRLQFNLAQYVITYSVCHFTFWAISGEWLLGGTSLTFRQLIAIVAAGAVHLLVNHVLVSLVVAFSSGAPLRGILIGGSGFKLLPYGMDMGLAPLSIPVLHYSPWLFPVLVIPAAVLHYSAKFALLREHEALHDVLTGMPNRALLQQEFEELMDDVSKGSYHVAVMLIDLDHFKEVNDTLGHQVGDDLLCEVARRLSSVQREGDTVARLGGDEFAVLARLDPSAAAEEAAGLAERLVRALEQPFVSDGVRMDVQGSVGIALSPDHGEDGELLMSRADIALYAAKERRGCYAFFNPEQETPAPERLSLLGELREAIGKDQLEIHYQPKVDVATGRVTGTEALVRWRHPTRGLLYPDQFIHAAENTGLIVPLTVRVLEAALAQTRRWADRGWELGVAVNLSVRLLSDERLAERVAEALERHQVPAHLLTLEVTESMLMSDPARAAAVLEPLRDLGVSIAIDDYGTGYSSLAYLRELDIDELKIDRSFIAELTGPGHDEVIVRSTIDLGHNLGLRVVAEGVEDIATVAFLAGIGCDVVQGYVYSKPLPADELAAWLIAENLVEATGTSALAVQAGVPAV